MNYVPEERIFITRYINSESSEYSAYGSGRKCMIQIDSSGVYPLFSGSRIEELCWFIEYIFDQLIEALLLFGSVLKEKD